MNDFIHIVYANANLFQRRRNNKVHLLLYGHIWKAFLEYDMCVLVNFGFRQTGHECCTYHTNQSCKFWLDLDCLVEGRTGDVLIWSDDGISFQYLWQAFYRGNCLQAPVTLRNAPCWNPLGLFSRSAGKHISIGREHNPWE